MKTVSSLLSHRVSRVLFVAFGFCLIVTTCQRALAQAPLSADTFVSSSTPKELGRLHQRAGWARLGYCAD